MTWSFKFLYTDLQNFWMFVLGWLVGWLWFFFPLLAFPAYSPFYYILAHIALFTISLAIATLFVLRYFKQSATAAGIDLCHLNVGIFLICMVLSESRTITNRHTVIYQIAASSCCGRIRQWLQLILDFLLPSSIANCFILAVLHNIQKGQHRENVIFSVNAFIHYSTSTKTKFLFVLLHLERLNGFLHRRQFLALEVLRDFSPAVLCSPISGTCNFLSCHRSWDMLEVTCSSGKVHISLASTIHECVWFC